MRLLHVVLKTAELCRLFVCLLASCRWVKQENELSRSAQLGDVGPKLDLGFKEGQTITLNIGVSLSSLDVCLMIDAQNLKLVRFCRCSKVKSGISPAHKVPVGSDSSHHRREAR